jgi:hypothetical protein
MQSWHTTYLGLKDLPRELSSFELQAFFTFSQSEREVIDTRYGATHKLGLALHIGFLRPEWTLVGLGANRAPISVGASGQRAWRAIA